MPLFRTAAPFDPMHLTIYLRGWLWFLVVAIGDLRGEGPEEPLLGEIRQLTFEHMGFDRAGEGYVSPDGAWIAFQAIPRGEAHYQIYRMHLASGEVQRISTGQGACTCAFFHPTEPKLLFASSHEYEALEPPPPPAGQRYTWPRTPGMNLYVCDLETGALTALTRGEAYHAECAYSPDGRQIVFASTRDGHVNLYLMQSDGSGVRQLTHSRNCYNGGPFFSPDGRQILFRADRERADYLQVMTLDLESGVEQVLTSADVVAWAPFWHPSGDWIAYTRSMERPGHYQLYLLDVHTRREVPITQTECFEGLPSFNRRGDRIVWTSRRGGGECQLFHATFQLPPDDQ